VRIGLLGGTFNPVHLGHLILAEEVREKLSLDKVIFVPAYFPPHKEKEGIAPAAHRFKMVELAIFANRHFEVSDYEIRKSGLSYTIDTVRAFKLRYPDDELFFISGSDLLKYLDKWKDLKKILQLVRFVVATRPGYSLRKIPAYIATVAIRAVDISAFEVRQCIREGKSFRYLVPEKVYAYIQKHRLYGLNGTHD
jgi:nicotinate-nucleotide adenylyltransferase